MPLAAQEKAQETVIDSQRSTIHHSRGQIHMLSAAARAHTTNIPISVEGSFGRHDIHGKMNGGGKLLTVHTSDGSVTLDKF